MAIGKTLTPEMDFTGQFNSTYNITLDLSGWDKTTIQLVSPLGGAVVVYATNDSGALQGVRDGNATLATNFSPVQVTNLATGTAVASTAAAGLFKYEVNAQFLRLQGAPAASGTNVYKILFFHSKVE